MYEVEVKTIKTYNKVRFTISSITKDAAFIEAMMNQTLEDVEITIRKIVPEMMKKEEQ